MTDYFTADLHFGHKKVIEFSRRPFRDVEEMDMEIVRRWVVSVKRSDRVFVLGDISLTKEIVYVQGLLSQLPGQKFWILGNHDHEKERKAYYKYFQKLDKMMEVKIEGQQLVLCHYAMLTWNRSHFGSFMLHGHSHGTFKYPYPARIADVGVDCWDYAPVSYPEIKKKLENMPMTNHHGA